MSNIIKKKIEQKIFCFTKAKQYSDEVTNLLNDLGDERLFNDFTVNFFYLELNLAFRINGLMSRLGEIVYLLHPI